MSAKPAYQPWEYVVRTFPDPSRGDAVLTSLLDREGSQEWELVAFDFVANRGIFKRRLKDTSEEGQPE